MKTEIKSIKELKSGDVVVSKVTGLAYIVHENYGDRATAVRTADITNPIEWELFTSDFVEKKP